MLLKICRTHKRVFESVLKKSFTRILKTNDLLDYANGKEAVSHRVFVSLESLCVDILKSLCASDRQEFCSSESSRAWKTKKVKFFVPIFTIF